MTNSAFDIYFKELSQDEEGNPIITHTSLSLRGHVEISNVSTIKQEEGLTNKTTLTARITDPTSQNNLKNIGLEPDYMIWNNKRYGIAEIRSYYTYIEIKAE